VSPGLLNGRADEDPSNFHPRHVRAPSELDPVAGGGEVEEIIERF
jgi:hypothetical protein